MWGIAFTLSLSNLSLVLASSVASEIASNAVLSFSVLGLARKTASSAGMAKPPDATRKHLNGLVDMTSASS